MKVLLVAAMMALSGVASEGGRAATSSGGGVSRAGRDTVGGSINDGLWERINKTLAQQEQAALDKTLKKNSEKVVRDAAEELGRNYPANAFPTLTEAEWTVKMKGGQVDNPGRGGVGATENDGRAYELGLNRHYLDALYAQDSKNPHVNSAIAIQDQHRGDHRAAYAGFETAISGGQDDARTLTFASLSALHAGDPHTAAAWSAEALKMDPGGPMAEQAEAISRLALKRLPKEEDPFKNRPARRPDAAGGARPGESVPDLDRPPPPRTAEPGLPPEAVALVAETNRLVAQASKAYRAGDIKEAVKLSGEALLKDPDDVRALQIRAGAMAKAGNWEEARKDAERGLDLAPGYVPLLLLRAAAAAHAKDWTSVKADAQAVLAKERANATAWRFAGLAESALGDRAAASASLARAAQYGDPEAPRLLAAARSLPPGADVVDLVELLAGSAAGREAAAAQRAAPPAAPPAPRGRIGLVVGVAVLAGLVAGGLILLLGRRDEETA